MGTPAEFAAALSLSSSVANGTPIAYIHALAKARSTRSTRRWLTNQAKASSRTGSESLSAFSISTGTHFTFERSKPPRKRMKSAARIGYSRYQSSPSRFVVEGRELTTFSSERLTSGPQMLRGISRFWLSNANERIQVIKDGASHELRTFGET